MRAIDEEGELGLKQRADGSWKDGGGAKRYLHMEIPE